VGQLALRDLALVGDGPGPRDISGSPVTLCDQDRTVQIAAPADPNATAAPTGSEIQLRPREQVNLATKGLQLSGVTTKPGGLVPLTITSSTSGAGVVKVPVLAPKDYYSTVTPAPTGS
jgi:hypothetical protein